MRPPRVAPLRVPQMPLFFVSYRRDDSEGHAGRLADGLERRFGDGAVFRDVDDIVPGADFGRVIVEHLDRVRAVLVLIGPRWLDARDDSGRRLDREDDLVRREIELALQLGKPVIPVLVGGARMMDASELPASLRALAGRHASELRDAAWGTDLQRLERALAELLDLPGEPPTAVNGVVEVPAQTSRARTGRWRGRWLGGAIAVAILALALAVALSRGGSGTIDPDSVNGNWIARVDYPWGVSMDERFEFVVYGAEVQGRAGFLGLPRAIEAGRVVDGRLQFESRTETISGNDPPRERVHRYVAIPEAGQVSVTLQSVGAGSADPPVRFTLRRP